MGTNYYAVPNRPSCMEPIHIGKSSYGWLFHFQSQNRWDDPSIVWNTYNQVKEWLYKYTVEEKTYAIVDEYDQIIPYEEFIELIDAKQNDEFSRSNKDNFDYARNVDGYRFSDEEFS